MRYFIIAGEQSGDLHGSNLIKAILDADTRAEIECWGGELMEASGARLLVHYRDLAFMGFMAVIKNLGKIRKNFRICRQNITDFRPDVVIFIDYPGFNLRMAKFASGSGFRTFYYISPKFWAWNEGRVRKVKKYVDRMFIIFPFEVGFYKRHGVTVEYYGNPLVDEIELRKTSFPSDSEVREKLGINNKPVIALLAGSRRHEIEKVLPRMVKMVSHLPEYRFILAGVNSIPDEYYWKFIGKEDVMLVKDMTYEILRISEAALVTSGTATLEAALLDTPQVVCYRGDFLTMIIAWVVVRVRFISLVNLIMDSEIVKELVQYDLTERKLLKELRAVLMGGEKLERIRNGYQALKMRLGPAGASARVAGEMVADLRKK
jgi:lipid-A-disaccharide synthase